MDTHIMMVCWILPILGQPFDDLSFVCYASKRNLVSNNIGIFKKNNWEMAKYEE
jgi:hypothetical protein